MSAALVPMLAAAAMTVTVVPATAAPAVPRAAQDSLFTPVSPVRVLDTRDGTGGVSGPVGPGRTATLALSARVPSTTTAVVLNVTAVTPTAPTHVTVFPSGQSVPVASNLNVVAGDIRSNLVTVALGTGRSVELFNNSGSVHVVADLAGYYATSAGSLYTAETYKRTLDTRNEGGPLGPGGTRVLDLTGSVPVSATAVTFNLSAFDTTADTFVTAWPAGTPRPTASNVNLNAGGNRSNLVTVALGANRQVSFYNLAGDTNLSVNLTGFYTPEFGSAFVPRSPTRVLDTRSGAGDPLGAGENVVVQLASHVPANATSVLLNVTGVEPAAWTLVQVWSGDYQQYYASNLNLGVGETAAVLAAVAFDPARPVRAYNNMGSVHVVADLAGVFVLPEATCTVDCAETWGYNQSWELGTGSHAAYSATAAPVAGLSGVTAVAGASTRYALRTDGTVAAWGHNVFGQLGGGWSGDWSPAPASVPGLTGVTAIDAGYYHALALLDDGTVRSWGTMFEGGWGNGMNQSNVPVPVPGLTGVTAIASAGFTAYALRGDGTAWSWGSNSYGVLGNGSPAQAADSPVAVTGLTDVVAIAAGAENAYALRADGTVWAWGRADRGQLGTGFGCATCKSAVPVQVAGLTGVTKIAGHDAGGYALRGDGTVLAWGANDQGQLGNGVFCDTCFSAAPVQVTGLTDVTALVADGWANGFALRGDGTVWAWGANNSGQLGNGVACTAPANCRSTVPVRVAGLTGVSAIAPGAAVVPD
ncbi:hypothetical protein [Actinophytocola sp.]|uniref:RCC1-like domain-containing protein n=1 Tax=Actinophytocola sp. TaxID=1872138 RepID=UPI002ED3959B